MTRGTATIALLVCATAVAAATQADEVTTYGVGLESCQGYLRTLGSDNAADKVRFVDWLSGYVTAVNRTSHHRNNFLGLTDLGDALRRIETLCRARARAPFAEAAAILVYGAPTGPAAHAIEPVSYGSADKSCSQYQQARGERASTNGAEFRNWLAGYISGVNAISLTSGDILGGAELIDAVGWLDEWCSAHPLASFGGAVAALVAGDQKQLRHAQLRGVATH